jgi:hypothetical protein
VADRCSPVRHFQRAYLSAEKIVKKVATSFVARSFTTPVIANQDPGGDESYLMAVGVVSSLRKEDDEISLLQTPSGSHSENCDSLHNDRLAHY